MPIRNQHRVGDWLMLDDESGKVHYRSEMRRIWSGHFRHKSNFETRQPQEFVRAKNDPKALHDVRPEPAFATPDNTISSTVGDSSVSTKLDGPAAHLYDVT